MDRFSKIQEDWLEVPAEEPDIDEEEADFYTEQELEELMIDMDG